MSNTGKTNVRYDIQDAERRDGVRLTVIDGSTSPPTRIAVITVRKARLTESGAERAQMRIKADAWVEPGATNAIVRAVERARHIAEASDQRPEGMDAPWEHYGYVRWTKDGYTKSYAAAFPPKPVPAGYYGSVGSAHWDWDRNEVVYGVSTIVPGAFSNLREATPDEFEPYEGNPYKDDLARTTPHKPLIDLAGERIEVTA